MSTSSSDEGSIRYRVSYCDRGPTPHTTKRYWAVVGNGPNRIAANEIRIKLSELCYKAIPEDGTEDKKHMICPPNHSSLCVPPA